MTEGLISDQLRKDARVAIHAFMVINVFAVVLYALGEKKICCDSHWLSARHYYIVASAHICESYRFQEAFIKVSDV